MCIRDSGIGCAGGCCTGNAHNARSKGITKTHQDAADRQDRDGDVYKRQIPHRKNMKFITASSHSAGVRGNRTRLR